MDPQQLRNILESCLLVAGKALSIANLESLFDEDIDRPQRNEIKQALAELQNEYESRGIELVEVASGWRLQSSKSMEHWVGRLFQEKQPRYSRALLETLVLIAYRQPITRGEIEDVRGVAVSSNIIRTLQEREWIKEMGYKDVPGKPALWGTTKEFLDYFNLKRLDELPTLAQARDLAEIDAALAAEVGLVDGATDGVAANDAAGEDVDADAGEDADADADADGQADEIDGAASAGEVVSAGLDSEDEGVDEDVADGEHTSDEVTQEGDVVIDADGNVEVVDTAEAEASEETDLLELAANLGKGRMPEPELGALVDSFADSDSDSDSDSQRADSDELTITLTGSAEDTALIDQPSAGESVGLPPAEAMEISAHDMDIEEWKEPASSRTAADEDKKSKENGVDDIDQPQAQTDLRRVIDDFAEEHRKQLDADSDATGQQLSAHGNAPQSPSAHSIDVEQEEPVSTEVDDEGVLRTKLYGVRGTVESELDPGEDVSMDPKRSPDTYPSGDYKDAAKGDP